MTPSRMSNSPSKAPADRLSVAPDQATLAARTAGFERAIDDHDRALESRGIEIWVGNEPTFTLRESLDPEWTSAAVGDEKTSRARRLVCALATQAPGSVLLRCIGRKYPGESKARFSFGLFGRRDGRPVFNGPPDPWLTSARGAADLEQFHADLAAGLGERGFVCRSFRSGTERRIVFAMGKRDLSLVDDERLHRESIHAAQPAEDEQTLRDNLAGDGLFLLAIRDADEAGSAVIELPALPFPSLFCLVLEAIAEAGTRAALPALILCGFPPPVNAEVSFLTVTPDPGVVELNMPPYATVRDFLAANRVAYDAAASVGLSTYRLRYNGDIADSGGAGQITFGGPLPTTSPFLLVPKLLPRLVRYALYHPAISYLFAHDFVGAAGQSVRADERGADALAELRLALTLLEDAPNITPAVLWQSLAPCLTDPTGNAHRAEFNVEKLWNPADSTRGQLGLVELRALRMQDGPERAAALAALLRAVMAMLMSRDFSEDPPDHGPTLHDRHALPFFLEQDLDVVLRELTEAGFGLGEPLEAELRRDTFRHWASVEFEGVTLTVRRAIEFWPLVGDAALQQGTSRLVDSSCARLELCLETTSDPPGLAGWEMRVLNRRLPLREETRGESPVRVFGIRYRSFAPLRGLHPLLGDQTPITLVLSHPDHAAALEIAIHDWRPEGGGYDDLPTDHAEAAQRRRARCLIRRVERESLGPPTPVAPGALSEYSLDLRYPPPRERTRP